MSAASDGGSGAGIAVFDAVSKFYDVGDSRVEALKQVSLVFERGSFTAIMGSSGSGKSTLLNLLGCLDRPSEGEYVLEGQRVADLDDDALSNIRLSYLGFIFQSFNLIQQLSVQENIEVPLYYLGWEPERSAARARELAAMVGLEERLQHRPSELSGGQQQRVAIARALANDPQVLLADEPTGNLDSKTGAQIMQMLEGLNQDGKTIVMVTHEPDIAEHAGRQVVMSDGRIESIQE
ncbi:MAG: ABC transporter ATP-binding protein [Planctomycetota bacterium]